jgi:hypothetical protein
MGLAAIGWAHSVLRKSVSLEKKTYGYRERDEVKRAAFLEQQATIPECRRVYVDESGMDESPV